MALVFNTPKSALNTTSKAIQNLSSDCPPCPEVNLTTADVEYTENGEYTITPEEGYDGLTQVDITVNIPSDVRNQDKLVTPTTSYQTITADSGYSGIGTVDVLPVTSSIDANIAAGNIKKDVSILGVTGTFDPQPTLQAKTATPTTSQQVIEPDNDKDGLSSVTVSAVTSSIDANISAGNIKKDVTILGVTGNYDPQPDLETKTVTYTTNDTYTITPTAGKDGMSSVEVTVNVTGSNCPDWSTIGWDCSDVTASGLDEDLAHTASGTSTVTDSKLIFAKKVDASKVNWSYGNCTYLRYVPTLDFTYHTGTSASGMFSGCDIVDNINIINADNITDMSNMFNNCYSLTTFSIDDTSAVTDMSNMFAACVALTTVPMMDTSSVTNMNGMFNLGALRTAVGIYRYNKMHLTTIPQFDTSNVTNVGYMFNGGTYMTNDSLTTLPELNFGKVDNILSMLDKCTAIANLGGFINLGKGFTTANNGRHQLNLSSSTVLTKQSIMNVINNLAAPDDTAVTDASLKLSATSYALLDASDIAIATAKGWNVISA